MPVQKEFESSSENLALKQVIIERIECDGGITFRDFMQMALYHPGLGYYMSGRETVGPRGDYRTSPQVSPIFGAMIGRQLGEMWEAMGRPVRFEVAEAGAGSGLLCRDVLRWARRTAPQLLEALEYILIEISEPLVERARAALEAEGLATKARWGRDLPAGIEGCILSNELLDATPVHRVVVEEGRLLEVFVSWDGSRFVEELRPPSSPEIESYFGHLQLLPGEGCRAEVNLGALEWMRKAASALRRGLIMTFDYGYEAEEMFAPWRRDGTLLCFYRHNPSMDPYARIGRLDMTAHVDFTSLRRTAQDAGLKTLGTLSQSQFLMSMGIAEALSPPGEGDTNLEEYYARRRAVVELLDPAGLGRIRVLVQSRGMEEVALRGLGEGRA